jgi:hypothetical protein
LANSTSSPFTFTIEAFGIDFASSSIAFGLYYYYSFIIVEAASSAIVYSYAVVISDGKEVIK